MALQQCAHQIHPVRTPARPRLSRVATRRSKWGNFRLAKLPNAFIFIDRLTISVIEQLGGRNDMNAKKDHALDNLRREVLTSTKVLSRGSGPELKGRRSFIRHMTSLGAGLAGSVILRATAESRSRPESPLKTKLATGSCVR